MLHGAIEARLHSGCGPGRVRQHTHRRTIGEALPRGLPGNTKLGTDVGPRHPSTASMGDEVVQQPIGSSGEIGTDRHASPEQHGGVLASGVLASGVLPSGVLVNLLDQLFERGRRIGHLTMLCCL